MAIAFYMDVHVPWAISDQLRRRGIDLLTAQEDNAIELSDEALLERATELQRVLFSQDIRFKALAEDWIRNGKHFAGFVFGHQYHGIGSFVRDLELIAVAGNPEDLADKVERLPYK